MGVFKFAVFGITHRSGSTYIQRAIGLRSDTFVWGESGNLIETIFLGRETLLRFSRESEAEREVLQTGFKDSNVFAANLSPAGPIIGDAFSSATRTLFYELYDVPEYSYFGVKNLAISQFCIEFFEQVFPECTTKIFIARNPFDSWCSIPVEWPVTLDDFASKWFGLIDHYAARRDFWFYDELVVSQAEQRRLCGLLDIEYRDFRQLSRTRVGSTPAQSRRHWCKSDLDRLRSYHERASAESLNRFVRPFCEAWAR